MDWLWIDPRGILECVRMFSHQGVAASTETWTLYLEIEKKKKKKRKKKKWKKIWRKTNILDNKIINWILVMILIIIIL